MGKRSSGRTRTSRNDPFEPLRMLFPSDGPLLADVLIQAVLDEEGISSPAVDEALLKCALRIHQQFSGPQALAAATVHQLLGGLYEEEERDRAAARHYRAALHAYARMAGGADQLPLALKTYQRILSRLGRSAQGRIEAKRIRQLAVRASRKRRGS